MFHHFKNPDDQKRGPNCGVTATAIAAGVSFNRAWNIYKTLGKAYYAKRQWKGGTFTRDQATALEKLRIEFSEYKSGTCDAIGGTLQNFVKTWAMDGKLYMVTTTSHVQCVMNGHVIDQRGKVPLADYWGKRKRVKAIKEIQTPFKHAIEREQILAAQKTKPAIIQPQSNATTLFPAHFAEKKPHSAAQQLTLF